MFRAASPVTKWGKSDFGIVNYACIRVFSFISTNENTTLSQFCTGCGNRLQIQRYFHPHRKGNHIYYSHMCYRCESRHEKAQYCQQCGKHLTETRSPRTPCICATCRPILRKKRLSSSASSDSGEPSVSISPWAGCPCSVHDSLHSVLSSSGSFAFFFRVALLHPAQTWQRDPFHVCA